MARNVWLGAGDGEDLRQLPLSPRKANLKF
jgi:hypothetical protein